MKLSTLAWASLVALAALAWLAFPSAQSAQAQVQARVGCPSGTYPNGSNCYPCLGCHPCGDSFCDNGNYRAIKINPRALRAYQAWRVSGVDVSVAAGWRSAQANCSQAKIGVIARLRDAARCDQAERGGRLSQANSCRQALRDTPFSFNPYQRLVFDYRQRIAGLQNTPASACTGGPVSNKVPCWSGVSGGGCAWAVCNSGSWWCWADCAGHGCQYID